jgi:hypothetical protein
VISRIRHVVAGGLPRNAVVCDPPEAWGAVVALQAQGEGRGTFQQAGVRGSMRNMAGFAAVDPQGGVLKGEGATLIRVALQARLLIVESLIHHPGPATSGSPGRRIGSVGIVAVRASHEALVHAMLEGHGELGADIRMAFITKVGLTFCQQCLLGGRAVYRVAVGANDIGPSVFGPSYVSPGEDLGMTGQTPVHDLPGRLQ